MEHISTCYISRATPLLVFFPVILNPKRNYETLGYGIEFLGYTDLYYQQTKDKKTQQ